LAVAATRSYNRHDLQQALYYCQQLYNMDPLCPQASLVHVATLLALNQKRILFGLAHAWVEASPKLARSWFAVGAYYYSCGRYHAAQRHFCRATRLDPQCTEAWIAFGCAFAACDESDQALATFRAAQRLAPAQHVPLLYMGMEYLRTIHLVLAQHFLTSAYKASGGDPLCVHELGVAAYQRCDYDAAIVWLTRALQAVIGTRTSQGSLHEAIDACQDAFWEPTLFNLGHCYRRTRQFVEAAYCFEKCLALCPVSS
jgi:anaphase-promoting complex subunit 6